MVTIMVQLAVTERKALKESICREKMRAQFNEMESEMERQKRTIDSINKELQQVRIRRIVKINGIIIQKIS